MLKDPIQCDTTVKRLSISKKCPLLKNQKEQAEGTQTNLGNKKSGVNNSIPATTIITKITGKTVIQRKESQKMFMHPSSHMEKWATPQREDMFEQMQQTGHFVGKANQKAGVDLINKTHRTV